MVAERTESGDMSPRDERPRVSSLGEWYEDLLAIDAAINGRSEALQGAILLSSKLQEREEKIKSRVRYLAAKRGITFEEMWVKLLKGDYEKLTKGELQELQQLTGEWQ